MVSGRLADVKRKCDHNISGAMYTVYIAALYGYQADIEPGMRPAAHQAGAGGWRLPQPQTQVM